MQIDPKFQPMIDRLVADVRERSEQAADAERRGDHEHQLNLIGQRSSFKTALGYALYAAEDKDVPGSDLAEQREEARTKASIYLASLGRQ